MPGNTEMELPIVEEKPKEVEAPKKVTPIKAIKQSLKGVPMYMGKLLNGESIKGRKGILIKGFQGNEVTVVDGKRKESKMNYLKAYQLYVK